ncbi:aminotransferase class I/II-fold pyridoxal phosphate-dependent enzyme [Bdellovibrio bacteriovorus]|uniref:aminotransferase class I/II-fold pyridoxal phosphate-dependent enzyme n=1 Tax=Bdellovibrio bacteriovorus TaxID=959 RepID=UPI0035A6A02F
MDKLVARKNSGLKELETVPGFKTAEPQGAFYFWVDIRAHLGKSYQDRVIRTSKDFCDVLLEKFFVATVPGAECGTEGFMRLSFAVSEETMKRGVARMKDLVSQLV